MPVATVDIGTNTLLLLIAEDRDGEAVAVHEDCRFGRLGQGLDASGRLADEAIERSLAIARAYGEVMRGRGVTRVRAVGTQALREAGNAAAFLEPARDALGADIEVISGDREAELVYLATARSFRELAAGELAVADVGGGSTEVIVGRTGQVAFRRSVPIGSVRLAERHLRDDPPTAEQARALRADVAAGVAALPVSSGAPLIGTAGTATTLAAVELGLPAYDPARVHGARLSRAAVARQLDRYLRLPVAERRGIVGLEPERADVIPAGTAIFLGLMDRAGADELIVSDRGVRWGLAYELLDQSM